ncbi:hypothetical protein DM02DRAFT_621016 [Periconia macrospinosa]|uniref:Zn(2)-C6 fungal-type domain-containing protein n=1 Tax=Periconia macrospinosa TaxID=97972 RepID=A0A2V1CZ31_9PLEO|nr:hypothetical protein DM02DRAFT_621016 [Periconia macrospinosa]
MPRTGQARSRRKDVPANARPLRRRACNFCRKRKAKCGSVGLHASCTETRQRCTAGRSKRRTQVSSKEATSTQSLESTGAMKAAQEAHDIASPEINAAGSPTLSATASVHGRERQQPLSKTIPKQCIVAAVEEDETKEPASQLSIWRRPELLDLTLVEATRYLDQLDSLPGDKYEVGHVLERRCFCAGHTCVEEDSKYEDAQWGDCWDRVDST